MDSVLNSLGEFVMWLEAVTPHGPLLALPLFAVSWLVARRWQRFNVARPTTAELIRLWSATLALSCGVLLLLWVDGTYAWTGDMSPQWLQIQNGIFLIVLAAPAHALRSTLVRVFAKTTDVDQTWVPWLSSATWIVFAGVLLLWLHSMLMSSVFPFGGGEFHAMFAYTANGRTVAALHAWRASVVILGISAIVFTVWVPLRWWVTALLACLVGLNHWWAVCTWEPQSEEFHVLAMRLLFALPVAVLLLSGAGALLGKMWRTRQMGSRVRPAT